MGMGSAGKKGPREMVNIKAPFPPGSRMVYPDEQEIAKRARDQHGPTRNIRQNSLKQDIHRR